MIPLLLTLWLQTHPPTVRVSWLLPDVVTEIQSSTNLTYWTFKTNVPTTVYCDLPADKPAEFFRFRASNTVTHLVSDWGMK